MDLRFWNKAMVWLIPLLLFPTRGALAGQSLTVAPTPFKTPPLVDGKLYDPIWRQGALVVLTKLGGEQFSSQQTFVRVGYDERALYVSFLCLEDQPQKIAATVKQRDRDVFQDDCVELFLAPHADSTRYYHFLVNAAGTQRDEVGMDSAWNANWQSGVTRDEKGWSVEMAIPYDQLSLLPDLPAEWGVNFCREEQPHGELSSWSPCREGFHEPGHFGKLVGMTADMKPAIRSTLSRRNDALARRLDSVRGQPSEVKARKRLPYLTQLLQSGDLLALYQTLLQAESEAQAADLEHRREALRKAAGDPNTPFVVCAESTMVKVRGDRPYGGEPANSFALSLARREYEPLQLVVVPTRGGLKKCRVTVSPLARKGGGRIEPADVTVNVVGFVKTRTPSGGAAEPAGLLPDPLLPNQPVDLPGDKPQPFWITVYARPELRSGIYQGSLTVSAEGGRPKVFPLSVRVHGFALPVRPALRTCFLLGSDSVLSHYGLPGPWVWTSDETNYASEVNGVSVTSKTAASGKLSLTGQASASRYVHFRAPVGGNHKRSLSFDYRFDDPGTLFVMFGGGAAGGKNAFWSAPDQKPGGWHHAEGRLTDCGVIGSSSIEFIHDNHDNRQPHTFFLDNVRVTESTPQGDKVLLSESFEQGLPKDQGQNLTRNFRLNMLAHRLSDCNVAAPEVKVDANRKVTMDWKHFDEEIEFYRARGLNGFNMNWLRVGAGWGAAELPGGNREQAREVAAELCRQTQAHLEAKGWTDDGYIYVFDEPGGEAMKVIKRVFNFVHQNAPKLKTLLTFGYGATRPWRLDLPEGPEAAYASLEGAVDLWVPHIDCVDWRVLERQRNRPRNELWHYVCISAQKPYPNIWGIDYRGVDHRIVYWQLWRYRLTGTLYWQVAFWQQNVWENPMSYPGGNGDGSLYYWPDGEHAATGSDGRPDTPVNSIRLELTRDGIEDYDYLALLQKAAQNAKGRDADEARELLDVSDLTPDFSKFTTDPRQLSARRERIGALIERLAGRN